MTSKIQAKCILFCPEGFGVLIWKDQYRRQEILSFVMRYIFFACTPALLSPMLHTVVETVIRCWLDESG